ncbi:MAG: DUF4369 domain-containing protein [Bacteroidales bacterium]|nr:DUF4369 domain-containing protein [Bacteroidales bacterium]
MPPIAPTNRSCSGRKSFSPLAFVGGLFCFLSFLVSSQIDAQQYVLRCHSSIRERYSLTLTIYDGDTSFRRQTITAYDAFAFYGSVKKPVLASLTSPKMNGTLFFYLENSDINITLNLEQPAASHVVGSRTNSQFRYAIENCVGHEAESCIEEYVNLNPTSIFAPFLIYERLSALPLDRVQPLFELLDGEARTTYHYHQLASRLARAQAVTEGAPMPGFRYTDGNGREVAFDTLRDTTRCNVILVGATWCASCRKVESTLHDNFPYLSQHIINIDYQPQKWDAPCLQMLVADHIPFLILVDGQGHIAGRDLRQWELSRRVVEAGCPTKK